jgi:prolyl-tRNA editing enzyme YbaK/EbsC (Cys-tRNA(Pro) deacylase)
MCGSELTSLPEGVQRVAKALLDLGHPHAPRMLDNSARTAQEAADALGIAVGQIAKSIIFRRKSDDVAVLVVTSGDRRVDEKKVEALVGKVGRADADFVKSRTGFSIGGVSPVAHATPPVTLIDQDLLRFDTVWAAAGHPHGVFALHPNDLQRLTGAPVADVVQVAAPPAAAVAGGAAA